MEMGTGYGRSMGHLESSTFHQSQVSSPLPFQNLAYNLNLNAPGKFLQHDAATAAAAAAARAAAYPHPVPGAAAAAAAAHHTASGNFQPGFPVRISSEKVSNT